uniref:Copper transport protein n=1 Tax=Acanthogobius hasta TaxID=267130 RepID=A0A140D6S9_9GOBI|nr:copper transporter 2 [Acanthogobius hasta]
MSMTFDTSSSVTLLFDFWEVHGAAGMLLSVAVVFLLTLAYEVLKVSRIWLSHRFKKSTAPPPGDSSPALGGSTSVSSLTPIAPTEPPPPLSTKHSVLLHGAQAALHTVQVALGYMLMLCVMSYNTWIFLAVICGSVLGYYLLFPLFCSLSDHRVM